MDTSRILDQAVLSTKSKIPKVKRAGVSAPIRRTRAREGKNYKTVTKMTNRYHTCMQGYMDTCTTVYMCGYMKVYKYSWTKPYLYNCIHLQAMESREAVLTSLFPLVTVC